MKAVILAAGRGTRLGEIGKKTPKSLLLLKNKPILDWTFDSLPLEITDVIIVVGHLAQKIKDHAGSLKNGKRIRYVKQGKMLGTAGALWSAKKLLAGGKFLVLNGDDIYDKSDIKKFLKYKLAIGVHKKIPQNKNYISIDIEKGLIKGWHRPEPKEFKKGIYIACGAYVLDDNIFKYRSEKISGGEYGLPQTVLIMARDYKFGGVIMKNWQQMNNLDDIKKLK